MFNPSNGRQRQVDLCEFKDAWSTEGGAGQPELLQRNPVSKIKKRKDALNLGYTLDGIIGI